MNYLISEAAKQVKVESHVLRYWEEELNLPIKRNEQGHRFYTSDDIERFSQIKLLKEQGLQLKAIRLLLKDGNIIALNQAEQRAEYDSEGQCDGTEKGAGDKLEEDNKRVAEACESYKLVAVCERGTSMKDDDYRTENKEEKALRVAELLRGILLQTLQQVHEEQSLEIKEQVRLEVENARDDILKELNYQFRTMEEQHEERKTRDEEYYKKLDELIRRSQKIRFGKREDGLQDSTDKKVEKKKKHSFF